MFSIHAHKEETKKDDRGIRDILIQKKQKRIKKDRERDQNILICSHYKEIKINKDITDKKRDRKELSSIKDIKTLLISFYYKKRDRSDE